MSSRWQKGLVLLRALVVKGLSKAGQAAGATVVPIRRWQQVVTQRNRLFAIAMEGQEISRNNESTLHGFVFSMNRPLQLHGLLNSYFHLVKNPAPLTVLYRATQDDYAEAYKEVAQEFAGASLKMVREEKFRPDLLRLLSGTRANRIFFFTDDDILIRPFDMDQIASMDLTNAVFSLRHGLNLSYCYTNAKAQPLPPHETLRGGLLRWRWRDGPLDWKYPLSVDGHVFQRSEILLMAQASVFSAPNTFEDALHLFLSLYEDRHGISFNESRLVNIPANKVQTENQNFAGNTGADWLLKQWQDGYRFDWAKLSGYRNCGVHEEMPIPLIKP